MCRYWKQWMVWVMLIIALAGLTGCASMSSPVDLSYADNAFSVHVQGRICRTERVLPEEEGITGVDGAGLSLTVEANVKVDAPGADGTRELSVCFTAPSALAGMTVTRSRSDDGGYTTTITRGELTLTDTTPDGHAYDGLLLLAYACLPVGDVTSVSRVSTDELTVTAVGQGIRQILTFSSDASQPSYVRYTTERGWVEIRLSADEKGVLH